MRSELSEIPPAARVLQLATASWMSAAVSAAAALGVADELGSGPLPVEEIAEAVGAHAPTLYRLLRACADAGLFEEHDGRVFELTAAGQALRSDVPGSMRNFALWVGLPTDRLTWSGLVTAVRTGRPAFPSVHGRPIWEYVREDPEVSRVFNKAMTEVSSQMVRPVADMYGFGAFRRVVDVGGGHGALLAAVLRNAPEAHGVLFDQPEVIAGAGRELKEAGVDQRCELEGGDFMVSVPAGGDAYLLSNVLHNWDDERAARILENCRSAMAPDGRVLVVEAVMPEGGAPSPVKLMDLNMLMLCGGHQRTEKEFAQLFQRAGLRFSRVVPGSLWCVVEAVAA